MSIFPSSNEAHSISEIRARTTEEQIVTAVNLFRQNPESAYRWIERVLSEIVASQPMKYEVSQLEESISIDSMGQVEQASRYFAELSQTTSVLSELSHPEQLNKSFTQAIRTGKQSLDGFSKQNRLSGLHCYHTRCVQWNSFGEIVPFLILKDYFRLIQLCRTGASHIASSEEIALLSNRYSTVFVCLGQQELWIGLAIQNEAAILPRVLTQPNASEWCLDAQPCWSYEHIPMDLVETLFLKLDTNRDNFVGTEDLGRQFVGMHVDLSHGLLDALMEDARASRFILFESDRKRDLSLKELYCAGSSCGNSVQVRRVRRNGGWKELPRPTSKYWRMLFRAIGIDFQIKPPTKYVFGKSGSIRIKNVPPPPAYNKRHSEGNLQPIFTQTIRFFDSKATLQSSQSSQSLSSLINGNIHKEERPPTMNFETVRLFKKHSSAQRSKLQWVPR